jgi:hypothetical protein
MALPDIDLTANQKLIVSSLNLQLKQAKARVATSKIQADACKAALDAAAVEAAARMGVDLSVYKLSEKSGKFVDKTSADA